MSLLIRFVVPLVIYHVQNVNFLMYLLAQKRTVFIYVFVLYRHIWIWLNPLSSLWIMHVKSKNSLYQIPTHPHTQKHQSKKTDTSALSLLYHLLWNKKIKFLLSQPRLPVQLLKSKNKLMFIWSSKELFKLLFLTFPLRHSTSFKYLYRKILIVIYKGCSYLLFMVLWFKSKRN